MNDKKGKSSISYIAYPLYFFAIFFGSWVFGVPGVIIGLILATLAIIVIRFMQVPSSTSRREDLSPGAGSSQPAYRAGGTSYNAGQQPYGQAYRTNTSAGQQRYPAGTGQRTVPSTPIRPASPAYPRPVVPQSQAQAAHLCDPGQHDSSESGRSYADTLNDLEENYRSYSGIPERISRYLSPEQYQKKEAELRALIKAGVIGQQEYDEKVQEYRSHMRG